jgi:hypothetical protein
MDQFENMFGCNPRENMSPLEKGDYPEIDQSEKLDDNGIKKHHSVIGCL